MGGSLLRICAQNYLTFLSLGANRQLINVTDLVEVLLNIASPLQKVARSWIGKPPI